MLAKREVRRYAGNVRVWVGKYRNLTNLPHWHDDCELFYIEKGRATVVVDGASFIAVEGQSISSGRGRRTIFERRRAASYPFFFSITSLSKTSSATKR